MKNFAIGMLLFLVGCTSQNVDQSEYTRILDETPEDIQEIENLTIFPGDAEPTHSIELIPEQTYGKSGEPYLTTLIGLTVDENGRVIIINQRNYSSDFPFLYNVYAYNADGTFRTQVGDTGQGPGEYGMVMGLQAKAGKVFILDYTGKRINTYQTADYSYERTTLIEKWDIRDSEDVAGMKFGYFKARNDGNIMVLFYDFTMGTSRSLGTYFLMDMDGNRLDFDPFVVKGSFKMGVDATPPRPSSPLPFMGETATALSREDQLHSAWSQDFLIKKYNDKGAYQSAIYYPVKGAPFELDDYTEQASYDESDVTTALDEVGEELPEWNPVIADMKADDENRIWVAVPTGVQSDSYEWWILEESGQLLAKLTLPRDQPIYDIQNGYLYSEKVNEETGTEYVMKYRIAMTKR